MAKPKGYLKIIIPGWRVFMRSYELLIMLKGKVALNSRGIWRSIVLRLAKGGAIIGVNGRNMESIKINKNLTRNNILIKIKSNRE